MISISTNNQQLPGPNAGEYFSGCKLMFVVLLRGCLGPLSEGGWLPDRADWGSVLSTKRHSLSQKSSIFASSLREGAEGAPALEQRSNRAIN